MKTNVVTKCLPIVSDEKRLEITLEDNQVSLKLSTWVNDLGWCGQKTIEIEAEMLEDLHNAISAARYKLNKNKNLSADENNSAKVLNFPSIK